MRRTGSGVCQERVVHDVEAEQEAELHTAPDAGW